jgi:HK97 gp10 family phage protein
MTDIHVTGLKELNEFLTLLPQKVAKNVLRGALRSGMKEVAVDAKAGAAVASGLMRDGLKISTNSKGGKVTASLKAKGKHGPLAHLIEFGTAAHRIQSKDGGALSFGGGALQHVDHPGSRAQPFMRPALDARASDAVVAAAEYMKERLATKHGLDTSDVEIEAQA